MKINFCFVLVALALKPELALLLPDLLETIGSVLEFLYEFALFIWYGLLELLRPFFNRIFQN